MAFKAQRIRDPLHNLIEFGANEFDDVLWRVIQTAPFQRLRRIKQLGFSDFVYPGATHSRFAHSIGVFHTARQLMTVVRSHLGNGYEQTKANIALAASLVHDVGHGPFTRLQKLAYFLELAGLGDGFAFEYRHYGPYSEELATAARMADFLGYLDEAETPTNWGGFYSVYTAENKAPSTSDTARLTLAQYGAKADPVELELAATAAFFATEGNPDPWGETARRKPEKAEQNRLANAKALYKLLRTIKTPKPLPDFS